MLDSQYYPQMTYIDCHFFGSGRGVGTMPVFADDQLSESQFGEIITNSLTTDILFYISHND